MLKFQEAAISIHTRPCLCRGPLLRFGAGSEQLPSRSFAAACNALQKQVRCCFHNESRLVKTSAQLATECPLAHRHMAARSLSITQVHPTQEVAGRVNDMDGLLCRSLKYNQGRRPSLCRQLALRRACVPGGRLQKQSGRHPHISAAGIQLHSDGTLGCVQCQLCITARADASAPAMKMRQSDSSQFNEDGGLQLDEHCSTVIGNGDQTAGMVQFSGQHAMCGSSRRRGSGMHCIMNKVLLLGKQSPE